MWKQVHCRYSQVMTRSLGGALIQDDRYFVERGNWNAETNIHRGGTPGKEEGRDQGATSANQGTAACGSLVGALARDRKVAGSISGGGTCLGCRFCPLSGTQEKQQTDVPLSHQCFSPSPAPLPLSLKSIGMASGEDLKIKSLPGSVRAQENACISNLPSSTFLLSLV